MIFALWHGGASYSPGTLDTDVEVFKDTAQAIAACTDRMDSGNWATQDFFRPTGMVDSVLTPVVGNESSMWVYKSDPRGLCDPYPDSIIEWDYSGDKFAESPA